MGCLPPSPESINDLRELRHAAGQRGDECLATLLAGVDLCIALRREMELLDMMRRLARDIREVVENTPSVEDLKRLYELGEPEDASG